MCAAAPGDGPLTIAITTLGGNPEIARAMAADVRLIAETGRTLYFLGKAAVYSAGATFMAGFPIDCRFMTEGTSLLLHERQITRTINLSGPLRSCTAQLKAALKPNGRMIFATTTPVPPFCARPWWFDASRGPIEPSPS